MPPKQQSGSKLEQETRHKDPAPPAPPPVGLPVSEANDAVVSDDDDGEEWVYSYRPDDLQFFQRRILPYHFDVISAAFLNRVRCPGCRVPDIGRFYLRPCNHSVCGNCREVVETNLKCPICQYTVEKVEMEPDVDSVVVDEITNSKKFAKCTRCPFEGSYVEAQKHFCVMDEYARVKLLARKLILNSEEEGLAGETEVGGSSGNTSPSAGGGKKNKKKNQKGDAVDEKKVVAEDVSKPTFIVWKLAPTDVDLEGKRFFDFQEKLLLGLKTLGEIGDETEQTIFSLGQLERYERKKEQKAKNDAAAAEAAKDPADEASSGAAADSVDPFWGDDPSQFSICELHHHWVLGDVLDECVSEILGSVPAAFRRDLSAKSEKGSSQSAAGPSSPSQSSKKSATSADEDVDSGNLAPIPLRDYRKAIVLCCEDAAPFTKQIASLREAGITVTLVVKTKPPEAKDSSATGSHTIFTWDELHAAFLESFY
jgi:hypothetical protein